MLEEKEKENLVGKFFRKAGETVANFFNKKVAIRRGYSLLILIILYIFLQLHKLYNLTYREYFFGLLGLVIVFIIFGGSKIE